MNTYYTWTINAKAPFSAVGFKNIELGKDYTVETAKPRKINVLFMSFGRAKRIWKFLTKIMHKWINNFEILKHVCWDWVRKLNSEKPNHPCSECQNYGLIILSKRNCLRQKLPIV